MKIDYFDPIVRAAGKFFPSGDAAPGPEATLDPKEWARCRQSLRHFVTQAWHVVEPHTRFVEGWHLDAICQHLQAISDGWIRNLLVNVPPRHMKSLAVSVFWPAWEWIRRPHTRWLFTALRPVAFAARFGAMSPVD